MEDGQSYVLKHYLMGDKDSFLLIMWYEIKR